MSIKFSAEKSKAALLKSDQELEKLSDKSLFRSEAFINNEWVKSINKKSFAVTDPANGQTISNIPDMDENDVKVAIKHAKEAYKTWSKTTAQDRDRLLIKWHDSILENKSDLAKLITVECGKPLTEAEGEVVYAASFIKWFAGEAVRAYGETIPSSVSDKRFLVIKQSLGVVGIITPWNFPSAMITRKIGAALAAGNTVVIKAAAETPHSALALCELAARVGIPPGVINVITTNEHVEKVGNEICTNPDINKISFTGSTGVGKKLMALASGTMKKVSFELGGNAPLIVFEDADLDKAVKETIISKFRNNGQTCVCPNRIYVHESLYSQFVEKLVESVEKLVVGHGLEKDVKIGPLIYQRAVDRMELLVKNAVENGGKIETGGNKLQGKHQLGKGNFFEPTVISGANDEMIFSTEEIFGPICPVYKFSDDDEVIARANKSNVGLAGYFFSNNISRIWKTAEALEVGMVSVNTGIIGTEATPFGGIKHSGIGREGSKYGLEEYLNIKTITLSI